MVPGDRRDLGSLVAPLLQQRYYSNCHLILFVWFTSQPSITDVVLASNIPLGVFLDGPFAKWTPCFTLNTHTQKYPKLNLFDTLFFKDQQIWTP